MNKKGRHTWLLPAFITFCIFLFPAFLFADPVALESTGTGNWGDANTWKVSGSNPAQYQVPTSIDSVTILSGHTITVNTNGLCASLTANNGGNITFNNNCTLTIYGAASCDGAITISPTSGSSAFYINGSFTLSSHGSLTMSPTGGPASLTADSFTTSSNVTMNPSNSATASISLSGSLSVTSAIFTMSPTNGTSSISSVGTTYFTSTILTMSPTTNGTSSIYISGTGTTSFTSSTLTMSPITGGDASFSGLITSLSESTLTMSPNGTGSTGSFSATSLSVPVYSTVTVNPKSSASASFSPGSISNSGTVTLKTNTLSTDTAATITGVFSITNSGTFIVDTQTQNDTITLTCSSIINSGVLQITGFSSDYKNVSIDGTIVDSNGNITLGPGYLYSTANLTLQYAKFIDFGDLADGDFTKWGICVASIQGYNNYASVVIDNNEIYSAQPDPIQPFYFRGWAGLVLSGCDHIIYWWNNKVSNNTIHDFLYSSIYLLNTNRSEVLNNTCYNGSGVNTGYSIMLENSSMNTLKNNTCYHNKYFNIYLKSSDKNFLENNTSYDSYTQDGIYLYQSNYNVLFNNVSHDNSVHAIALDYSSNNIIVKNNAYSNGTGGFRTRYTSNTNIFIGNYSYANSRAGFSSYDSYSNLCMDDTYGSDGTDKKVNTLGDIHVEGEQNEGKISQFWLRNCLLDSDNELADTSEKQEFSKPNSWIFSQKHDQQNGLSKLFGQVTLPLTGLPQGTIQSMKFNYADSSYPAFATTPYLRFDYSNSGISISEVTFSELTTEPECWIVTYDTGPNRWYVRGTTSGIQLTGGDNGKVIPDTDYTTDNGQARFRITQSLTPNEYGIEYVFVTGGAAKDTNVQKQFQLSDFSDPNYIGAKFVGSSGATIELEGTSAAPTIVEHKNWGTRPDYYYGFELTGCTLNKLNYTTFKYLNTNGLKLSSVPSSNSTGLRIENVATSGTHMTFESITHTFDNIYLDNSGVYNSSGTATVTFRDYYRYNLSDGSGVSATWDPTLSWSGQSGFTEDGVNPNDAITNSNFEFQIKYTDKGIAANGDPPSAIQVWVDSNDNGTFEDTEKHDMVKVTQAGVNNNNYTDGETYTYTYSGMTFAGDGKINYRFYATNNNSTTMIGTTTSHEATGVGTTTVPEGETPGTPTNGYAYLSISGSAPRVNITTPTTEVSGEVTFSYTLIDNESNTCSVICEYTIDSGATWKAAKRGAGGDPETGLVSSPSGEEKTFVWDTRTDLPNQKATVKFKITPSDIIGSGTAGITDSFDVVNTASASSSTVTCSPETVPADGTTKTTITIRLKDPDGNAVADKEIEISATGDVSRTTVTQPTAKTDGNGETIAYIASTKAEQKIITATIKDDSINIQQKPTVTFTPLAVDADKSTVIYTPSEIVADGAAKATITVTLMDKFNNVVAGKQVTISSTGTGNSLTQPATVSDANGQAHGTLASTKMETKTVSARDVTDNITLNSKATIVFVPVSGLDVDNTTLVPGDPAKQNISIFYANSDRLEATLQIFNLTGALIFEKQIPANNVAIWDGKDADGQMVETGIYIYQLDIGGTIKNGAIAIVK